MYCLHCGHPLATHARFDGACDRRDLCVSCPEDASEEVEEALLKAFEEREAEFEKNKPK
jgi:hypothetical protein